MCYVSFVLLFHKPTCWSDYSSIVLSTGCRRVLWKTHQSFPWQSRSALNALCSIRKHFRCLRSITIKEWKVRKAEVLGLHIAYALAFTKDSMSKVSRIFSGCPRVVILKAVYEFPNVGAFHLAFSFFVFLLVICKCSATFGEKWPWPYIAAICNTDVWGHIIFSTQYVVPAPPKPNFLWFHTHTPFLFLFYFMLRRSCPSSVGNVV